MGHKSKSSESESFDIHANTIIAVYLRANKQNVKLSPFINSKGLFLRQICLAPKNQNFVWNMENNFEHVLT